MRLAGVAFLSFHLADMSDSEIWGESRVQLYRGDFYKLQLMALETCHGVVQRRAGYLG